MNKESSVFLVAGCGGSGLEWTNKQKDGGLVIGLDHTNTNNSNPNFIYGDVLNLPFKKQSVSRIYADYLFNAASVKDIPMKEIVKNPIVLKNKSFPKTVNDWFTYSLNGSEESVRKNLENIRWLLRIRILEEMIGIAEKNGEIYIIDRPFITNWIETKAVNLLGISPGDIEIKKPEITSEDYMRSASLRMIAKEREPIGKILLRKLN